jgi:hypothetical protein
MKASVVVETEANVRCGTRDTQAGKLSQSVCSDSQAGKGVHLSLLLKTDSIVLQASVLFDLGSANGRCNEANHWRNVGCRKAR